MLEPKIQGNSRRVLMKTCSCCGISKTTDSFIATRSWIYADSLCPVCNECIKDHFISVDWSWDEVDAFCQRMDVPFIPREFEKFRESNGDDAIPPYCKYFTSGEYERFGWLDYHRKYLELKEKQRLDLELPLLNDSYYDDLRLRWGESYDEEQLIYLENLYNGLLTTQNVNGALQIDQAQKLCKMSLNIDERIRAGIDFDKLMGSYEKLTKIADFTPKNTKSDNDFASMGELVCWLENRGWLNTWYDDANRDIVDEVIHSQQAFVQRLYTNEAGLGEEINDRIEALKIAAELDKQDTDLEQKRLAEDPFFETTEVDLESHDNQAYEDLIVDEVLDQDTVKV